MIDLRKYIKRNAREKVMYALRWLPDKPYLQLFYFACNGKFINFKHPVGFNEKQNWLKIYDRHPEYCALTDKLAVKKIIDEKLGEGHVFPLLGSWEKFEDIDFDSLPERFVLKNNHDSGSTKVITKSKLTEADKAEYKKFYNTRLKRDFFCDGREYYYKGIKPRIMAEALMVDEAHPETSVEDYKFFCFDGVPKIMFVATDRATDVKFDFFDMDFNHLDIVNIHPQSGKPIPKPAHFDEMKDIAAKLSQGMKFCRVDLYEINGTVYFGEYTFYHGGGFRLFYPLEWERRLGDWIKID